MSSKHFRNRYLVCYFFAFGTMFLLAAPGFAFDVYTEMPPLLNNWDSNTEIHIHSAAEANAVRQNVVDYLWGGRGLPTAAAASVATYNTGGGALPADLVGLNASNIASADKLQANMDFGYSTSMYLLHPTNTSNAQRLAIVHHGHVGYGDRFSLGIGSVTDNLLKNGFTVLEMQMPLMGWNTQNTFNLPSGAVNLTNHNAMVSTLEGQGGSSLRFFLEPVVQGINKFVQSNPGYSDISMMGLSGGGWTTTLAPAIDSRIKTSIPVAGSLPLPIRDAYAAAQGYGYNDDAEQELAAMYKQRASYEDLYILAGYGAGRKEIQLNIQYDNCCFYGISSTKYIDNVKAAVASTGAGTWDFYLDTTTTTHQISANAIANVIDPALGIIPIKPLPPAINEQFTAVGTPPPGWSYDPHNGGTPTISSNNGVLTFSGGSGVVSIVNNTTFDPKAAPITATMKINSVGAGGYLGMFFTDDPATRAHHFGLQVRTNGDLILNSDPGGGFRQKILTNLTGYNGGPITLTLIFDANGFAASTDFGNYSSGFLPYSSLGNGYNLDDLGSETSLFVQNFNTPANATVDWITVVPEPSTLVLLGMGAIGLLVCAWPRMPKVVKMIRVS